MPVGRRVGKYFPARTGKKPVGFSASFNKSIAFVLSVPVS